MKARVKQGYRLSSVTAFGGWEFIKHEWRDVPEGFEADALRHDLLETDEATNESSGADLQRSGSGRGRKRNL